LEKEESNEMEVAKKEIKDREKKKKVKEI